MSSAMVSRRVLVALVSIFAASLMLLMSTPALATKEYVPGGSFVSEQGAGNGEFNGPTSIAVNEVTLGDIGDVYVLDKGNNRVEYFSSAGAYVGKFNGSETPATSFSEPEGIAVDNDPLSPSRGDVYVADVGNKVVDKFSSEGKYLAQLKETTGGSLFEELHGVAVDPSGDLWVYQGSETHDVDEFSDTGVFLKTFSTNHGARSGIAVDSAGNVYVITGGEQVYEFASATGNPVTAPFANGVSGLAVNSATENLLVDKEGSIGLYGPFGEPSSAPLQTFPTELEPPLAESDGVAVNGTTGTAYVTQHGASSVEVFDYVSFPDVESPTVTEAAVTLHGSIDPEGETVTECKFEYGTAAGVYPNAEPCAQTTPFSGAESLPLSATLTGLQARTTYYFRLTVRSARTKSSEEMTFFTSTRPLVVDESISNIGATTAIVSAQIDAAGLITTFHVEYGTPSGSSTKEDGIGAPQTPVTVPQELTGLQAATEYHLHFLATNSLGVTEGAEVAFTTLAASAGGGAGATSCPNAAARQGVSAGLPDCRVYEQVTPVNKGSAEDMFGYEQGKNFTRGYPSEGGDGYLLITPTSLGADGASGENSYAFSRGSSGWTMTSLAPPELGVQSLDPAVFDPTTFSTVGIEDFLGSEAGGDNREVSLVGPLGGPYTSLPERATVVGASSTMSRVVLESKDHELAPGDSGQDPNSTALYEWSGGQTRLVNVNTDGSLTNLCGATLGIGRQPVGGMHNTVSSDGSKIFFTAPDPQGSGPGCWEQATRSNPPQLYMRVDGSKTVEISAPNPGVNDPDGPQPAEYVGASTDGSKVFFISQGELTADDTTHVPELYEYNTETLALTRISSGVSGHAVGDVGFVPAISSDGSTVYFTAGGQLAPGAPALSYTGEEGSPVHLYRYDTSTEMTTYVTTVNDADYQQNAINRFVAGNSHYDGEPGLADEANWYTTPDGRYLVFDSIEKLTGFNNAEAPGANCEGLSGTGAGNGYCSEVFLYDSVHGSVTCVSCASDGAAPISNSIFERSVPTSAPGGPPLRAVSDDGSYVFFDTNNALVSGVSSGLLRVYEWHDGTLSLISTPQDPAGSFFLGASADASNAFIGSHAQLAPQDTDSAGDLYDARIDGGFSSVTPSICTGTACQGVPAAPPLFATPSSETFEGVGNFPPPSGAVKTKGSMSAQKLKAALGACRRDRAKRKRARCEAHARALYDPAHKSNKSNQRGK
jgi:hypothetical protein